MTFWKRINNGYVDKLHNAFYCKIVVATLFAVLQSVEDVPQNQIETVVYIMKH